VRTSTHVSYLLTAASVNAGRVKAHRVLSIEKSKSGVNPLVKAAGNGKVGRTWGVC